MSITGFNIPSQTCVEDLEYRLAMSILPLRCYLDGRYVQFLKIFSSQFSNHQPDESSQVLAPQTGDQADISVQTTCDEGKIDNKTPDSPPSLYFQSWQVNVIDLKIDYTPDQVEKLFMVLTSFV